jgi:hypothetical protein
LTFCQMCQGTLSGGKVSVQLISSFFSTLI